MPSAPRFVTRAATLVGVEPLAREVKLYRLELDGPIPFAAGQFVNLAVPGAEPRGERSYSVWSSPHSPTRLELCIKLLEHGAASDFLRAARVGQRLQLRGPFGTFLRRPDPAPSCFVATGTGLAPFHAMLLDAVARQDPRPVRLYWGVRDQGDLFAVDELEEFRRALPDFDYTLCLSRPQPGWTGFVGRVTRRLAEDPSPPQGHHYLCGNGPMIEEARALLLGRGLERALLHYEKYY